MDEQDTMAAQVTELLAAYRAQAIAGSAVVSVTALHDLIAGDSKAAVDASLQRAVAVYEAARAELAPQQLPPAITVARQQPRAHANLTAVGKIAMALKRDR